MAPRAVKTKPVKAPAILETAAESSTIAGRAGIALRVADAAWVANKVAQREAAIKAVRGIPYDGHEPANTFGP